jgi:hypothetical protein
VSALTLVLAIVACAAAAVAPSYRDAAAVSALRARMTAADPAASGVEVAAASWPGGSPDAVLARRTPHLPLATAAIRGIEVAGNATQLAVPNGPPEYSRLVWRQDDCAHVVFRSGRCPTRSNEIALPVNAAAVLQAPLGSPIVASSLDQPDFGLPPEIGHPVSLKRRLAQAEQVPLHEKVVGLFDVPPGQSYWFGQNITAPVLNGGGTQVTNVTALVPRSTLTRLPLPYRSNVTVDQPLDWSHATVADVATVQRALKHMRATTPRGLTVLTSIPTLLAADASDRHQLNRLVALAQIQLLLLIGLVLIAILGAGMERRRAEFVIATLEGRRAASTAVSIAAEPVSLLLLGLIPGVLVSLPLALLGAHLWLRPGTPVHITGGSVLAAVVVTAVAALVTVTIGCFAASRSLADQLAEDASSAGGRAGAWIDVIAITLAAAGLTELFASHSGSGSASSSTPWSLLAPSLCGLAAGLMLGRLVPTLLRPVVRATAQSSRLGRFLAIRELRRDHAAWRVTAVVALALSLLSFAVTVNRGASSDREDRAGLIVGAPTVATVLVPPGGSVLAAVDRVDPTGRWAMAAELLIPYGSPSQRTLALDTPRLAAVAGWNRRIDGYTPAGLAAFLHVPASIARTRLPLLTAGNVDGSTFGLNNQPLTRARVFPTSLLPQLLNEGALADLRSMIIATPPVPASTLGSTGLINQVWLGAHAPPDAMQRLRSAGLTITAVTRRADVASALQRRATTAGLSAFAAVAIIAAILAVALLLGTSVAASSRQRMETLALVSAGVSRSAVVKGRAGAAGLRVLLAAAVAFGCGIATVHLSAHLIPQAALGAVPVPLLPLPWLPALIAVLVTVIPAVAAEMAILAYTAKRADAVSLRSVMS